MWCGRRERAYVKCPEGHYICESCHNKEARSLIETFLLTTKLTNPFAIASLLLEDQRMPMLGCHHAYMAGGILACAIKNAYPKIAAPPLEEIFARIEKQAHGGYCGLTGVCGIVPAIGAVFAVLTQSHCGTDREQKMVMEVTTAVSRKIWELTGPSCCRAYLWASLSVADSYLRNFFQIELPTTDVAFSCMAGPRHPHGCRGEKCPYKNIAA